MEGVAPQLLTTSNFIGPWYHAALLFSGLGSIVLLFGVLFSQQIREDHVRAATSPYGGSSCIGLKFAIQTRLCRGTEKSFLQQPAKDEFKKQLRFSFRSYDWSVAQIM